MNDPFDYRATKAGQLLISRGGRTVVTMAGDAAARLLGALCGADEQTQQLLLAKATGNYRHGNER